MPAFEVGKTYRLTIPETTQQQLSQVAEQKPSQLNWQKTTVKSGDTLAKIFNRLGYDAQTTHAVSNSEHGNIFRTLKVGDKLEIPSDEFGEFAAVKYPLSTTETLLINNLDGGIVSDVVEKQVDTRIGYAQATITSNFWNAALKAGLTNSQIMNLANIFGWDVDFALDIREGDSFAVMFEDQYIDGEFVGHGNILAAEFINQGEVFKAIRFDDGEYYNEQGNSMRKSFLRAPVSFQYISSNFKPKRYHPILKRYKAHNGTDYRAPKGTPVKAAGNGRVIASTYNKYNGHYVFIQHANNIVTKYLHFSKRKVKKGQRVKQGDIIGLVGSTGLSQAPHLHYEFLLNGVHRNPRTVKLPDAEPIGKKHRGKFEQMAQQMFAQLEGSKQTLVAATGGDTVDVAE
ncbi:peptidoglycan DD-metalloendopeptidase family protein [Thalassotalea maritima]|uniref:peptidoglycan DD-metalloendopeptidase family protein n=1 Tax=Thalassotalea maritima TaxID=3242416 RepID=UPI003907EC9A